MSRHTLLSTLLVPVLFLSTALAQIADWESVKALPGGTKIKVQLKHGRVLGHCYFDDATDEELACAVRGTFYSRRWAYPRSNVKAVFRAHNGMRIGVFVGAGAGALMGAATPGCCRAGRALLGGAALGVLGGGVGTLLDPFFHGKAVYRSQNNLPTTPQPQQTAAPNPDEQKEPPPEPKIPCLRDGTTLQCVDQ